MKDSSLVSWMMLCALALPSAGDEGAAGRPDLRQLQAEVDRLDDTLLEAGDSDPRSQEFQQRVEGIREDLAELKHRAQADAREDAPGMGVAKAELDALRAAAIDLRDEVDRTLGQRSGRFEIPGGTEFAVRLGQSVSSRTARPEERVEARVTQAVRLAGTVAIPAGTSVQGSVLEAQPARRSARGGRLDLAFDSLVLRDGRTISIQANVVGPTPGGALTGTERGDVELKAGTELTLRLQHPAVGTR